VSCAAALAAIEVIESEHLCPRAERVGGRMVEALTKAQADTIGVGDVRGRGAMIAIELVDERGKPDADRAKRITVRCHEQGVIVLTAGTYGNVVRLLPPLNIDDALLDDALDVLTAAITTA
jgi:4-aminobutyrate aminotransferase/(S)-3-amino-2-methylpropionate transaminase